MKQSSAEEVRKGPTILLLSHFREPIPWQTEAAAALSDEAIRWDDFGLIYQGANPMRESAKHAGGGQALQECQSQLETKHASQ